MNTFVCALQKFDPRVQARNPVMFLVFGCSVVATFYAITAPVIGAFEVLVPVTLWLTVLFANVAEAVAEGKGKAQTDSLRQSRQQTMAKKLKNPDDHGNYTMISATSLAKGDYVFIEAGDLIAGDGQVVEGVASVDESAITGESAPVIRESGGDRDAVTAGTRVLSDWLVVRITTNPGETFLDRMIALVEAGKRQKTPNEMALGALLAAMSLLFLLVVAALLPFSQYIGGASGAPLSMLALIALLICLAPTTIGGLISAIGIAGMNRLLKRNVVALSGRAVEAAGDAAVLLLDKTGTITHGNRQAVAFVPAANVSLTRLAEACALASLADETPEGRSIVALAYEKYAVPEQKWQDLGATFIPFTAETRVSGVTIGERSIWKGAGDAVSLRVSKTGGSIPADVSAARDAIAREGGTPLLIAEGNQVLGVIQLKDIVKAGIKVRLAELRRMGIKSIMITGDNPLTAAAIAAEAGVDDFLAEATPEAKLKLIRKMQDGGELVAMVGDGTNDAPALAQADVALVMNSGTQAAKEAGNMVDLDSDPTKLIEIVEIGKQLLMTRGALTTFSFANDLAKYFALLPALFVGLVPGLAVLNIMQLSSPASAISAALIYNALSIIALVPLALRGVSYRPAPAGYLLRRNLLVYGVGGVVLPFAGIKLLDMLLAAAGVV